MQLSKNFTLEELSKSAKASELGIDNTPSQDVIKNLILLVVNTLQPVRDMWGAPIRINSGYRCKKLNDAVKGSKNSMHISGQAVDITVGNPVKNKELFDKIVKSAIPFDQIIDESKYSWIHISFSNIDNRRQILHL